MSDNLTLLAEWRVRHYWWPAEPYGTIALFVLGGLFVAGLVTMWIAKNQQEDRETAYRNRRRDEAIREAESRQSSSNP